ncbi:MAG TPA: acylphosphatase [Thermoanaerobaculia bacterium]|jgi:acylphosphatase
MDGFEETARKFVATGRVQGVGFRAYSARVARALRLSGGASNLEDGSVVVWARGPRHALDRLEAALWEGSRLSRIEKVVVTECPMPDGIETLADVTF